MENRLLERKSSSVGFGLSSRDFLMDRPCQQSSKIEFRSTISLCVGILFVSLFLFCALDPVKVLEQQANLTSNGGLRFSSSFSFRSRVLHSSPAPSVLPETGISRQPALQGMGTLFRRGTQDMHALIVAHVSENVSSGGFRLFLRSLHRSGATARADVVLLYDSLPSNLEGVLEEEEVSFQGLLAGSKKVVVSDGTLKGQPEIDENTSVGDFNSDAFWKADELEPKDAELQDSNGGNASTVLPRWGSIIGFELQELDPENALLGFLDSPSVQLRRWLCYQMLLGVVSKKYKHVLLTEVEGVIIIDDALSVVRKKQNLYLSSEDRSWSDVEHVENVTKGSRARRTVREILEDGEEGMGQVDMPVIEEIQDLDVGDHDSVKTGKIVKEVTGEKKPPSDSGRKKGKKRGSKKGKGRGQGGQQQQPQQQQARGLIESIYGRAVWNSLDRSEKSRRVVSSGVIMGDVKLMRTLTNKMATEIVRVALDRQNRQPFHDKAILNYLVCKSSVLGKRTLDRLRLMENKDSVVHSLRGTKQRNVFFRAKGVRFAVVQGYRDDTLENGQGDAIAGAVHRDMCRSALSSVYRDCSTPFNSRSTV